MSKKNLHDPHFLFVSSLLILALLFAACTSNGGSALPGGSGTTAANHTTGSGAPLSATQLLPVSTRCPAAGTARAAVMQSTTPGSHKNILYIVNQGDMAHPSQGTLKRYDVVTGGKTEILTLSRTYISDAVLSADGQWILFVSIVNTQVKLQLVRIDGRMLQTLYCASVPANGANPASTLNNVQWSTDQKLLIFNSYTMDGDQVLLLNIQTGSLRTELTISKGDPYPVAKWLDNARVYLLGQSIDAPADSLYLLDTNKGSHQPLRNLTRVFQDQPANGNYACWDFDSSYDGSRLYTSACTEKANGARPGADVIIGPSQLNTQPAVGGMRATPLYSNASVAITAVRAVSSKTLLLLFENQSFSSTSVDTSQNGLWEINSNGTGLKRLTSDGGGVSAGPGVLCQYSQYPWSNVSRDGAMYALQHDSNNGKSVSLLFGSLHGGDSTTFASISDGTQLSIIGWTTM